MARPPLRRLVAATVLALGLGSALTFALGAAQANGAHDGFTFAVPGAEDQWEYSLHIEGTWVQGTNDTIAPGKTVPGFALTSRPDSLRLADGLVHDLVRTTAVSTEYQPGAAVIPGEATWSVWTSVAWSGPAGPVAFQAWSGRSGGGGSSAVQGPAGLPALVASEDSVSSVSVTRRLDGGHRFCLDAPVAAGTTLALGETVLLGPCRLAGALGLVDPSYTLTGTEAIEFPDVTLRAARFEGPSGDQVWFAPGIPYPVQVRIASNEQHGEALLRLTGYASAGVARPLPDQPREPAPTLEWAAAKPWGPDDAGSAVAFPLSAAYLQMESDEEVGQWLREHPRAEAVAADLEVGDQTADYVAFQAQGGTWLAWHLVLSDPDGCVGIVARHENASTVPDPWGLFPGPTSRPQPVSMQATECPDASAPLDWPTIASVRKVWEAYAPPEELAAGFQGWAFAGRPSGDGGSVWAGRATIVAHITSGVGWFASWESASAGLRIEDGSVRSYTFVERDYASSTTIAGLQPPQAQEESVGPASGDGLALAALGAVSPAQVGGVGLLSVVTAGIYLAWPALKSGGLATLFSRVDGPRLLDHPARARIVQLVEARPGIHYQELVRESGNGKGTLEHHLKVLVASGHVRVVRQGGYRCHFAAGVATVPWAGALKSEGARRLLQQIHEHPGRGIVEAAAAVGLSPGTASHHLRRLEEAGLVVATREGRVRRLSARSVEPALAA